MEAIVGGEFGLGNALNGSRIRRYGFGSWVLAYALWMAISCAALFAVLRWRRGRA
jgi:hypothetical protein